MTLNVYLVAAFTETPFKGNPAGVCVLDAGISPSEMQAIAAELKQPETAFVHRVGDAWAIRWFSPTMEVELCGHATLAAAHVLWSEGAAPEQKPLRFESRHQHLLARLDAESRIWLTFPALWGTEAELPPSILACVDRQPRNAALHANRWLVEYGHASDVRSLSVDIPALLGTRIRSLIVTAPSDDDRYDIVSRNFAPMVGVDEDHVTGMAHTCLAPHWALRLGDILRCWQASPRGGSMTTRLLGTTVELGGKAVLELLGHWRR